MKSKGLTTLLVLVLVGCGAEVEQNSAPTLTSAFVATTIQSTTTSTTLALIAPPPEADIEACRIPEPRKKSANSQEPNVGFPVILNNLPASGIVKLVVIPVQWTDYPGDKARLNEEFEQVKIFTSYYETISKGAIRYDVTFVEDWLTVPGSINDYPQDYDSDFNYKLVQAAIDVTDPIVDFSGTQVALVIIPENSPIPTQSGRHYQGQAISHASFQGFDSLAGPGPRPVSDEGRIPNWMGAGAYFDDSTGKRNEWSYYVHETGHMFELPDYYVNDTNNWLYSPWEDVEPVEIPTGPFNYWSVMASQDGPSRTMETWSRWLVGWLDETEIYCFDARAMSPSTQFDLTLTPLDLYNGRPKAVIVRTGESTGFVIESRRPIGPDETLNAWQTNAGVDPRGLIVYRVDTAKGHSQGTLAIVPPDGHFWVRWSWNYRQPGIHLDALYHLGDTTVIEGVKIDVRQIGTNEDIVRLIFSLPN